MESTSSSQITAAALQARLTSQTHNLIQRLENILATLIPNAPSDSPPSSDPFQSKPSTTHVQTSTQSFQLSVETTALVRACEELMGLTRGMKEIWLSGGLDTLEEKGQESGNVELVKEKDEEKAREEKMRMDQERVMKGFMKGIESGFGT